ncbi:MAG: hypothetical protein AB1412_05890 [Pseudomonadota bacterium]
MRPHVAVECLFRTSSDGRRVFYPRMWRGPGVQLRDAAQEAAVRRELWVGFNVMRVLMVLALALLMTPAAVYTPLPPSPLKASGLLIGSLVIFGVIALQWHIDHLLKDCPGITERLTQRDYETCLARHFSVTHLKLRIAGLLLLAAATLGLALFDVSTMHISQGLLTAIPLVLLAAASLLPLKRSARFLGYKRSSA